ncbi:monocarboxylate transporter 10-like [Pollicipes pollicipes]|uniref:monocarboxylate transporter 10-like n=1 Tax=Pollicipes pollicipes TaxID=41117 RepID=UPI00188511C1|nr:monocarboxylate transporter 10-like [Pollicipes pollicipes]
MVIQYVRKAFPGEDGTWLVLCLGLTSGLGRLVFGRVADLPRFNKIMLQQLSFVVIGTLTILLPFCRSFPLLVAIALGMGLFDGCFISLLGPIAFELVGPAGASAGHRLLAHALLRPAHRRTARRRAAVRLDALVPDGVRAGRLPPNPAPV